MNQEGGGVVYARNRLFLRQVLVWLAAANCAILAYRDGLVAPFTQTSGTSRYSGYLLCQFATLILCLSLDGVRLLPRPRRRYPFIAAYVLSVVAAASILIVQQRYDNLILILQCVLLALISLVSLFELRTSSKRVVNVNGELTCGLLSYVYFSWLNPLLILGSEKHLESEDLPPLIDDDQAAQVWKAFRLILQNKNNKWSLFCRVFELCKWEFFAVFALEAVNDCLTFVPPFALEMLVSYLNDYDDDPSLRPPVVAAAAALFVAPVVAVFGSQHSFNTQNRISVKVRSAHHCAIFDKALRIDMAGGDRSHTVGQMTNLVAVDSMNIQQCISLLNMSVGSVVQLVLAFSLLFIVMGQSATGALVVLFLLLPLNGYVVGGLQTLQQQLLDLKDKRMNDVTETLQGIKIIKMYAWENIFTRKVATSRAAELRKIRGYMLRFASLGITMTTTPITMGLFVFLSYTLILNRHLSSSRGFAAVALLALLEVPLILLPVSCSFVVQAVLSLRRIERFLDAPDVRGLKSSVGNRQLPKGEIVLDSCTFSWPLENHHSSMRSSAHSNNEQTEDTKEENDHGDLTTPLLPSKSKTTDDDDKALADQFALLPVVDLDDLISCRRAIIRNLSLKISPGSLVCIYGPTGCGKSTLLQGILGECILEEGEAAVGGRVALVSQKPWIQNATLRDNILFGAVMNEAKYAETIQVCALEADLVALDGGDLTEIGEKGVNLSGGQQQRVNLGRAVYSRADVYLLDDPLSAVDAHVGEHLYLQCVCGVLRGTTRVLVTHQVALTFYRADRIIILDDNGSVVEDGSPVSLMRKTSENAFVKRILASVTSSYESDNIQDDDTSTVGYNELSFLTNVGSAPSLSSRSTGEQTLTKGDQGTTIVSKEERQYGRLKWSVLVAYASYAGGATFLFCLSAVSFLRQGFMLASNVFLGKWMETMTSEGSVEGSNLWCYIGCVFGVVTALGLRSVCAALFSVRASRMIHDKMLKRIVAAPMRWFDTTPLGRILNRFTSDMTNIDLSLVNSLNDTVDCSIDCAVIIGVVCVNAPFMIMIMVGVVAICIRYASLYIRSSRELKRLESISKSPLFSQFNESLSGLSTIRAFQSEGILFNRCCEFLDSTARSYYYLWVSPRWLAVRIQTVGAIISGSVGVFIILASGTSYGLSPTQAGLALLYSLQFTGCLNWSLRSEAQLEMYLNSVERTEEYCCIEQEAAAITCHRPPEGWPSRGEIVFEDITMRYSPNLSQVLKGVSFTVPPGAKVGIVGRTGAGKSSLLVVLFRLMEPEGGDIRIDGVSTLTMGLRDLRSAIAIVPQDPVLFRGSIRSNLSPSQGVRDSIDLESGQLSRKYTEQSQRPTTSDETNTDPALWNALERVHMKEYVMSLPNGLDSEVTEAGNNLSVGQRQLLCMARAVLKQARVIVLDEATANVDQVADQLIQDTIRNELSGATVLTIAHRLHTVAYYDLVLVMKDGVVAEYARPLVLMDDSTSLFHSMCVRTGDLEELRRLAQKRNS